jgi:5-methylcytosine-specific restriction endonuclease McrA
MFESNRVRSAREVLSETDQLVAQNRGLTLRVLVNLHEIERNKFYLEFGYGSMFDYCTLHLKYPESSAARYMRAARCLADYPQLAPLLESGDVNSTSLAMVAKHIKPDNAPAIIEAIKGKSTRDVERFIAALHPSSTIPPDRTRFHVLPVAEWVESTTSAGSEKSGTAEAHDPIVVKREVVQFKRMVRSEFTAEEETMQKLDRIRSLASHRLAMNAPLALLIDFMADYFLEREDPIKRQERRKARAEKQTEKPARGSSDSRHIPAAVRDEIHVRDRLCTYIGPDGKRCNSPHVLQVDHIKPVARKGAAVIDNLRLLCAKHNRLEAQRLMGRSGPLVRPT